MSLKPKRKICWPGPTPLCLDGSCTECKIEGGWINLEDIIEFAEKHKWIDSYNHGMTSLKIWRSN